MRDDLGHLAEVRSNQVEGSGCAKLVVAARPLRDSADVRVGGGLLAGQKRRNDRGGAGANAILRRATANRAGCEQQTERDQERDETEAKPADHTLLVASP